MSNPRTLWKPTEFRNHPVPFSSAMRRGLWRAIVRHIYDADSVACFIDKGFFDYQMLDIRIKDIDAPEVVGENRAAGLAAKDAVIARLLPDRPVLLRVAMSSVDLEKRTFERFVADVIAFDPEGQEYDFGEYLVWGGYAVRVVA
jgi:endonuclease YncB( thermonuclease family)